eukprot:CAMPEP_0198263416 /NCGR_PEP_ID=MMETSP1447-20131203/11740_1 /TAXON_ID=420782 /ORGANISM="Chaetoceros dichaeta, Strain CCMP1751" /LENGTH=424 /DNA_ID=CAMNT_0043951979 /DNA_START=63 /DNA_END=1337 /DNA_ORIENTATION=+
MFLRPNLTTSRRISMKQKISLSVALVFFITLTKSVGSDAGAIAPNRPTKFAPKESPSSCLANLKRPNGQCMISRGGSTASAAPEAILSSSASESLKMVGVVGSWFAFRNSVVTATREFWREADRTKFLLAGAVAGIVSRTAVSPLEVIATAQMVRGGNKNIMGELVELFRVEGLKGFFKGNGANCLKVAPTRGVQFLAFESFKLRLVAYKKSKMGLPDDADITLNPAERLIAGGFAGMIASSMVYPIEVVKTMLTMYPGKYNGINAAFRGVINEVGPKGLYAGLTPTLIAMFPYVGMEFMIYETSKIAIEAVIKRRMEAKDDDSTDYTLPIVVTLGLGAIAGAAAQTSAHPLDVVRKRLQIQGINGNPVLYKNTFDCIGGIVSKEGAGTLYKGLRPACVATIPGTGIAYITYEFMKVAFGLSSL